MKKTVLLIAFVCLAGYGFCATGSVQVGGDFNNFYPVSFTDGGWFNNAESTLELNRSSVHDDSNWRGALMAKLTYHVTNWGNGANFIDAKIANSVVQFIAGWVDATPQNGNNNIVVWLRGGGTTYFYTSNFPITAAVYDGAQNPLPYQVTNGPAYTFKTTIDAYVNSGGISTDRSFYFNGAGENYFNGGVGIGTYDTNGYLLAVKGNIHARQVNVDLNNWADYVFNPEYRLKPLSEIKAYIDKNHHLPDIPSEKEMVKNGLDIGEMNTLLMKKVEELTLYLIEKDQKEKEQEARIKKLEEAVAKLTDKSN